MATIQIRDIPEDAYEVIRRRARAENRSIQSYMLEHVLEFTSHPTKQEIFAKWAEREREHGSALSLTSEEIAEGIREDRRGRQAQLTRHDDA